MNKEDFELFKRKILGQVTVRPKQYTTRMCPNCRIRLTPFMRPGRPKVRRINWRCGKCGYVRINTGKVLSKGGV